MYRLIMDFSSKDKNGECVASDKIQRETTTEEDSTTETSSNESYEEGTIDELQGLNGLEVSHADDQIERRNLFESQQFHENNQSIKLTTENHEKEVLEGEAIGLSEPPQNVDILDIADLSPKFMNKPEELNTLIHLEQRKILKLQQIQIENQNSINESLLENIINFDKISVSSNEAQMKALESHNIQIKFQRRLNNLLLQNIAKLDEVKEIEKEEQRKMVQLFRMQVEHRNKTDNLLNQNLAKLEGLVQTINEEQKNMKTDQIELINNINKTGAAQFTELKVLNSLMIDSIRELRQHNLQNGEALAHQKARLQSYKVRHYDPYKE